MNTPWGSAQETTVVLSGVLTRVETASHGGFFVHEDYRTEVRPSPTLDSTTWYEEDCDWAVAWTDLNDTLRANKDKLRPWYRDHFDELTRNAYDTIARWFPDLPDMLTCYNCGFASNDPKEFTTVNEETAHYDMNDPYPGSSGDLACKNCH